MNPACQAACSLPPSPTLQPSRNCVPSLQGGMTAACTHGRFPLLQPQQRATAIPTVGWASP